MTGAAFVAVTLQLSTRGLYLFYDLEEYLGHQPFDIADTAAEDGSGLGLAAGTKGKKKGTKGKGKNQGKVGGGAGGAGLGEDGLANLTARGS